MVSAKNGGRYFERHSGNTGGMAMTAGRDRQAVSDVIDQFRDAILNSGLTPPKAIIADGEIHRFATNGRPGDKAGWYVLHPDGIPAGGFGDWRTGEKDTWHAHLDHQLTKAERAAHQRRIAEFRKQREAEEKKLREQARQEAAALWTAAEDAPDDHPYLRAKGVRSHGLRIDRQRRLIVPVSDNENLHSLQTITPNGEKLFLMGGRKKGCYFVIGNSSLHRRSPMYRGRLRDGGHHL
jgi:putative DNA primase/helicase